MDKYITALKKYFDRFSEYEIILKCGVNDKNVLLNRYLLNAQFIPTNVAGIDGVVLNSGVEFELPHTLDRLIIIPKKIATYDINEILRHELIHICFRYGGLRDLLYDYCRSMQITPIVRPKFEKEISNPDTRDYYGLAVGTKIIFIVLEKGPKKMYYTAENGVTRQATINEQSYYDKKLPYEQNYHPEEIIATILAR